MSSQPQQEYLARVYNQASESEHEAVTTALSKRSGDSTRTELVLADGKTARMLTLSSSAQIRTAVAENITHRSGGICIIENISQEYIEVLGSAWDIDPAFFVQHAVNPSREGLWNPRHSEYNSGGNKNFGLIDGNFEYHGLNVSDKEELNSLPNHFERHCFRSPWEGAITITSNTRISYYRVQKSFYLFLVDAPLEIQKRYDDASGPRGPSLRLPYARNRGGLQLQSLFELRDKKGIHYSLFEVLKSVFLHGWQRDLLFNYTDGLVDGQTASFRYPAFPPPLLCYILSNSVSQKNLRYLSQEIRLISFREIRDPSSQINGILHDRREDLVANFKVGMIETIRYMPVDLDKLMRNLDDHDRQDQNWIGYMTEAHSRTLQEALELEKFLMETFQLLMSSISVQDAKTSILQSQLSNQQALRTSQLTVLASIYVPLSFATGIFGMNVRELNDSKLSIWVFVVTTVVAVMVTVMMFSILNIYSKHMRVKDDIVKVERSNNDRREAGRMGNRRARPSTNIHLSENKMA